MGNPDPEVQPSRVQSVEDKKDEGDGGIQEGPKKPGSKAQERKRTKTGCLSELFSCLLA
jgi:hypothetical protein